MCFPRVRLDTEETATPEESGLIETALGECGISCAIMAPISCRCRLCLTGGSNGKRQEASRTLLITRSVARMAI